MTVAEQSPVTLLSPWPPNSPALVPGGSQPLPSSSAEGMGCPVLLTAFENRSKGSQSFAVGPTSARRAGSGRELVLTPAISGEEGWLGS